MSPTRKLRTTAIISSTFVIALGLAACTPADETPVDETSAPVAEARNLIVGTSGDFPPLSSLEEGSTDIVGFENDMMTAVIDSLGWTFEWTQMSFDGLLPAVTSGRIDAIVSGMYHTEARAEEADFIDYMQVPMAVMTRVEDSASVAGPTDLCGQSVAHLVSSAPQAEVLAAWSEECQAAGLEPIIADGFPSVAQAVQAVATGRAFAELEGDVVALYIAKTQANDLIEVAFNAEGRTHAVGLATAKDAEFAEELSAAIQEWIDSDDYCETAEEWGLTPGDLLRSCD